MIQIAARMPGFCAAFGFVLAIVCSIVVRVPATVALWRAVGAMSVFTLVGMVLGLLMAGVLGAGRGEERGSGAAK
jgi:hypothetical protein